MRHFGRKGSRSVLTGAALGLCVLVLRPEPLLAQAPPSWFPFPWPAPQQPAPPPGHSPREAAPAKPKPKPPPKKEAKQASPKDRKKPEPPPGAPPPEAPPAPFEPQLLRLAEILGALAYLDDLCGSHDDWRKKMQEFLAAEAQTPDRKERLAGAFNRSFHDFENSYRLCSPNAQVLIGRFLDEGGKVARDVVGRFSAT